MSTDLPTLVRAVREEQDRRGVVVVQEWLKFYPKGKLNREYWFDMKMGFVVSADAARFAFIGMCAEWLGGQGVAVVKDDNEWWYIEHCCPLYSMSATDSIAAHYEAAMARLQAMPRKREWE